MRDAPSLGTYAAANHPIRSCEIAVADEERVFSKLTVDHPFFGLFSIARGGEVKSLLWCGELKATQRLPNGWRVFWFEPNVAGVPEPLPPRRHQGGFF